MRLRPALGFTAAGAVLALGACGLQPATSFFPDAGPGSLGEYDVDPDGPVVVVTSKDFTEQIILGKIGVIAAASAGFPVEDRTTVPGSVPVRQMMLSGEATMTWEYTGTAWLTYLGETEAIADQQEMYEAVRDADEPSGLTWLPPSAVNNTYAMAVNREFAERTGIENLSGMADLDVDDRTFCVEPEFNSRNDGFNPMLAHYGLERGDASDVPEGNVAIMDAGTVYTATADGATCNLGEVFTTDARIEVLDLVILEDDEQFFPSYNAAAVLNTELLQTYPELEDLYGQITEVLTDEVMLDLNLQVDIEGREPALVAFDFLLEQGFVSEPDGALA